MGKASLLARFAFSLGVGVAGVAQAAALLSMEQFRGRVAERIRADHPGAKVTPVGVDQLRVDLPGGKGGVATLERAFGIYQGNPQDLPDILKGISGTVSVSDHRPPATVKSIVLVVRREDYAQGDKQPMMRPIAGRMAVLVAQELPDSFAFPSRDELRRDLKLDDKLIWNRALANTRAHLRIRPTQVPQGRITHVNTGGYFASSLLADEAFWNSPPVAASGPLVVFAMARDDIYVARLSDTELVGRLRKMAVSLRDDPNGLTNDLIVRRNGHWETLP